MVESRNGRVVRVVMKQSDASPHVEFLQYS